MPANYTTVLAVDKNGHGLTKLWEAYRAVQRQDKPQDEADVLSRIKDEARRQNLVWDYCDAAERYVDTRSRINWKDRRKYSEELKTELEEWENASASLYFADSDAATLKDFIESHRKELQESYNPQLYANDNALTGIGGILGSGELNARIGELLDNDYEYALWKLYSTGDADAKAFAKQGFAGNYPMEAIIGFDNTDKTVRTALEAYVQSYSDKAIRYFAVYRLKRLDLDELQQKNALSDDYKRFHKEIRDCIAEIASTESDSQGKEQLLASMAGPLFKDLAATLESSSINYVVIENSRTEIGIRNMESVDLRLEDSNGHSIWKNRLDNERRSFYALDTLECELPDVPDGSYTLYTSGDKDSSIIKTSYYKYTLSIARSTVEESLRIYVADYLSGEPVASCDLSLKNRGGNTVAEYKNFLLDGFTELPENIKSKLPKNGSYFNLQASLTLADGSRRLSFELPVSIGDSEDMEEEAAEYEDNFAQAVILTDKSAFNPGETVNCKFILFSGEYGFHTAPEGLALDVKLSDPDGNVLAETKLRTNEFGSAAGSFKLEKANKGGNYTISVSRNGSTLKRKSILVDEFVLPSFNLVWEPAGRFYLLGDTVSVKGNVAAYSGHMISGAKLKFSVMQYSETVLNGELTPDAEGNFEISFPTGTEGGSIYGGHYSTEVTVTDETGETLKFTNSVYVREWLPLEFSIENRAAGTFSLNDIADVEQTLMVSDDTATVLVSLNDRCVWREGIRLECRIGDKVIESNGNKVNVELPASGLYILHCRAVCTADNGKEYTEEYDVAILKTGMEDTRLDVPGVQGFFRELPDEELRLQMGSTCGPVWAVVELFGNGSTLLEKKLVYFEGECGKASSLHTVVFERKSSYPEMLDIRAFYFKDKGDYQYVRSFRPEKAGQNTMGLQFVRFLDTTLPSSKYEFVMQGESGIEACVTIFDAASETLKSNLWTGISPEERFTPNPYIYTRNGTNDGYYHLWDASRAVTKLLTANTDSDMVYESIPYGDSDAIESAEDESGTMPRVRSDFASSLAWEPFLRSDENGQISFSFNTSDKLSTYYVQVFAHDKEFRNIATRKTMTVSIPVKVSIVQPQYLYESDRYVARAVVSSNAGAATRGTLRMVFMDDMFGEAVELKVEQTEIEVMPGGTATFSAEICGNLPDRLGILVSFIPADMDGKSGDAVYVSVPVKAAVQTVTEAHSMLYRPGMDKEACIGELRSRFVNADGSSAALQEISIRQMLMDAIPEKLAADSEDALSLCDVLWADSLMKDIPGAGEAMSEGEREKTIGKLLSCRNSDGGYAWFAGMYSSPLITATVLDKFIKMGDCLPKELAATAAEAVGYLDDYFYTSRAQTRWWEGPSMGQYLNVRAHYASVPLNPGKYDAELVKQLKKGFGDYLVPAKSDGLSGNILEKARRISTLEALLADDAGLDLAKQWNVGSGDVRKLRRRIAGDVESLTQYAVEHASGGMYYPNAVMPFRGLLDNELYAHSMLCTLMSGYGHDDIAEGIRLWIMVQKETQQWDDDPEYLAALASVLRGSEETLSTSVLVLSGQSGLPFSEVQASGNGFSIERQYYLNGKLLTEGDSLHVGDRIVAIYKVHSDENRSFVKLCAPRPATLRPVLQVSGAYSWRPSGTSVENWYLISPMGYRSVRSDRTEFFFDVFPEEDSQVSEEFFVTQEGQFISPVVEIESLYAPHYRANGAFQEKMNVQP